YQGKSVGTFGQIGIFSFNNNKAVTGFGGGAIVTNNSHLAAKARFLAAQAREDFQFYEHRNIGFNYGINPLAAAYALSQLVDIEKFTIKRKTLFKNYKQLAPDTFITQQEPTGVSSGRWLSTFLLPEDADGVGMVAALKQAGIEARSVWKPMHQQPLLGTKPAYLNGNSDDFFKRGICLPSGNNLDEATQNEIISVMNRLLQRGY
ncbi:MAG TPA: DegT/DnrJ/EryC1/StrS family aminotransferase, partial [Cyclobacteriaceae bacterium]|nr:DegT/DnrJ/EryC1/StrS family aminotransferase [Cyclobacteriaceae bacterium]